MPSTTHSSLTLPEAYKACDDIARRDKPHLYAAARHFSHAETRSAFASTYASMRVIDDFIDDIPERSQISNDTRDAAQGHVGGWLARVQSAADGVDSNEPIWKALADTFARFPIPLTPWQDLAGAMVTDLFVSQFRDWDHLKQYMRGASVAPAIVFMHFVLMHPAGDGRFRCAWDYNRVAAATEDLAIFCYWVHILRDVAEDLTLGKTGLVYFPKSDMDRFGLSIEDLHAMRVAKKASDAYLQLAAFETERAREHLAQGMSLMPAILAEATEGHAHALNSLVETYATLLEEIVSHQFDVFAGPVTLTQAQLSQIQD